MQKYSSGAYDSPPVLKVNSLRVFSLGFVIAGRSFLPVGMEKGQSIFSAALVGKQSYSSAFESSVPAPSSVYSSAGIELTASCSSGDKELYHSSHSRVSSVKSDLLNDCPLNSMVPLEPIKWNVQQIFSVYFININIDARTNILCIAQKGKDFFSCHSWL